MKKERGVLGDLIDGYEIPPEHRNSKGDPITGKTFFSRSLSGSVQTRGRVAAKPIETAKNSVRRLVYTSTRVYGASVLLFGALATVARVILEYFGVIEWSYTALAAGLVLTLFGVGLMLSDKPIGLWAESFALTDYVCFEFFCIKRLQKSAVPMKGYHMGVGITVGIVLAALGSIMHPLYVVLAIATVLFVAMSLASPEFSFLMTVMLLPYVELFDAPVAVLAALIIVSALSFVRKIAFGKRVFVFEQYDLLIFILMSILLISGTFVKGVESFGSSVLLVVAALGYTLASNLVTNRRLADRVACAVVISAFPASVYAITSYVISAVNGNAVYSGEGFYAPEVFAAFLVVALFFAVSIVAESKLVGELIFYSAVLVIVTVTLAITLNYFAFLAVAFGAVAYLVLKLKRFSGVCVAVLIVLPNLLFLLPSVLFDNAVASTVFGGDPEEHRALLLHALELFAKNPFVGIGVGTEAFAEEISAWGISADNCKNTFLEIACEAGVFAIATLAIIVAVAIRHRSIYRQYVRDSQVRTVSKTAAVVTVALIVYAAFSYIWSSFALCYLFWIVFGVGSSTLRIAKREHDDRIMYFNDVVSSESSDVDVQIDGFTRKN